MAEINARKRGRCWEYYFEVARVKGKRKRFSKGGFTTKADALSAGTKAMNEYLNAGTVFVPKELSVSDYMDYWIEMYCRPNLKPSTIASYKKYIRLHISPKIGHKNINVTMNIYNHLTRNQAEQGKKALEDVFK